MVGNYVFNEITLAEIFNENNYKTGIFGNGI
jgi:hypothetical protein